jgi:hypothetical protein
MSGTPRRPSTHGRFQDPGECGQPAALVSGRFGQRNPLEARKQQGEKQPSSLGLTLELSGRCRE